MEEHGYSYKRNKLPIFYSSTGVLSNKPEPIYQYPEGHPCFGCPYTLNASVPSCMFPNRRDGTCFWYEQRKIAKPPDNTEQHEAMQKLQDCIAMLEAVIRRKTHQHEDTETE